MRMRMTAWRSRPWPNHRMRDIVGETTFDFETDEDLNVQVDAWARSLKADEVDGELVSDPCFPHCDGLCIWAAVS